MGRPRKNVEQVVSLTSEGFKEAANVEAETPINNAPHSTNTFPVDSAVPSRVDPEWSDYVLKQFTEDELVEGRPVVAGLRRVTEKLLGRIVRSVSKVIQADEGRAVAEHVVEIQPNEDPFETMEYGDAADVFHGNVKNNKFLLHAVGFACTRAEVRALRKALNLRTVGADEVGPDEPQIPDDDKPIESIQRKTLEMLFKRHGLLEEDVWAKLNIKGWDELTSGAAKQLLGDVQKNPASYRLPSKGE